jgi:hypothetical protein
MLWRDVRGPSVSRSVTHRAGTTISPVGFQNSATGSDLRVQAAGSHSLIRPPRTGRRRILLRTGSGIGDSGRGGRSCRARCGRCVFVVPSTRRAPCGGIAPLDHLGRIGVRGWRIEGSPRSSRQAATPTNQARTNQARTNQAPTRPGPAPTARHTRRRAASNIAAASAPSSRPDLPRTS